MPNQTKVCQGERILDDYSQKIVTHRFQHQYRDYEQGVSVELCPLFDFSVEPWILLRHMHRELILAHQVTRFTKMDKVPARVNVLDVACGYAEQFTLLSRIMKAGGTKLKYVGVDIDEDKKVVAQQLRSTVDYRIMDILDIVNIADTTFNVIICGETIEHVEEAKAIEFMSVMCSVLEKDGFLIMSFPTKMSETHRDNPFHIRLWDLPEVMEIMKSNNMEILDAFHLGVSKHFWNYSTDRIPTEIFRTAMSAMVGSEAPGPDAILICQKTWE